MTKKIPESQKYVNVEFLDVSRRKIIMNIVDKINALENARVLKAFELNEAISIDPETGMPRRIAQGVGLQIQIAGQPQVFSLSLHINPMETQSAAKQIVDLVLDAVKNPQAAIEADMPKKPKDNLIQVVGG